jgi:hypothetical protein
MTVQAFWLRPIRSPLAGSKTFSIRTSPSPREWSRLPDAGDARSPARAYGWPMEALGRSRALVERWADWIVPGVLLAAAELDVWMARAPADAPAGWALVNALLVAGFALPLLMRRRAPLIVLVLVIAAGAAQLAYTDHPPGSGAGWVALNVALYSVAAHGGRRTAMAGAVLVLSKRLDSARTSCARRSRSRHRDQRRRGRLQGRATSPGRRQSTASRCR